MKKILLNSAMFLAIASIFPNVIGDPTLTAVVNGQTRSLTLVAGEVGAIGNFELLHKTPSTPSKVVKAELTLTASGEMLDTIEMLLSQTDFDLELFDDLKQDDKITFILGLGDDIVTAIPQGGVPISEFGEDSEITKIMKAMLSMAPADGTMNLWTAFVAEAERNGINLTSSGEDVLQGHGEVDLTNDTELPRLQLAADSGDNHGQMGEGDDVIDKVTQAA